MPPDILMSVMAFPESVVARLTDLASGWLLTYLVHSTVLLVSAWLITSSARTSDAVRDILWKCALVGGLVTATIQMGVAREPLAGQLRLAPRTGGEREPVMRVSVKDDADGPARYLVTRPRGTRWTAGLVVLWLTSSGAGLLWLTVAHARSLRALGERRSLDGTPIAVRLRALLRRTSVNRMVELTSSSGLASPVALPGDEICLPGRALFELEPNELDGMLAHEVAHLVRRDPQWLIVARAMEIVFFMQPLNGLARRRMQEVAEYLCDDWAVSRMRQPVPLARCLAAVAEWVSRAPLAHSARLHPMSAMVDSGGSSLVRRVGRILDGHSAPGARSTRLAMAASALVLVALVGIAPRVSVAHAALTDRKMTFVREVAAGQRVRLSRDTMIVLEGGVRVATDSVVMRRRGAATGGVLRRANVIVVDRQPAR